jgi:hypothetical protein
MLKKTLIAVLVSLVAAFSAVPAVADSGKGKRHKCANGVTNKQYCENEKAAKGKDKASGDKGTGNSHKGHGSTGGNSGKGKGKTSHKGKGHGSTGGNSGKGKGKGGSTGTKGKGKGKSKGHNKKSAAPAAPPQKLFFCAGGAHAVPPRPFCTALPMRRYVSDVTYRR